MEYIFFSLVTYVASSSTLQHMTTNHAVVAHAITLGVFFMRPFFMTCFLRMIVHSIPDVQMESNAICSFFIVSIVHHLNGLKRVLSEMELIASMSMIVVEFTSSENDVHLFILTLCVSSALKFYVSMLRQVSSYTTVLHALWKGAIIFQYISLFGLVMLNLIHSRVLNEILFMFAILIPWVIPSSEFMEPGS